MQRLRVSLAATESAYTMPPITSLSQLDLSKSYTYADYLTWQLTEWVELIRGKVRPISPAPQSVHQTISFNLNTSIGVALRGKSCRGFAALFDVRLTKTTPNGDASIQTEVQPDICTGLFLLASIASQCTCCKTAAINCAASTTRPAPFQSTPCRNSPSSGMKYLRAFSN